MGKYEDGISDRLKMDVTNWPHQFTKDGKEYQIGEDEEGKKFAVPMVCIHCHVKFVNGMQSRPPDPCPARNKKRELERLLR